ncbi:MAG TPA: PQQ-binding-like beta-propeller repeat protein [Planctomycetaceae bacterium]|jgi:outer membrane protein assembly factor BamB|nr:PQQ-binding-like beta-propeller repeat protein [Planctomycetaceae bacterium]
MRTLPKSFWFCVLATVAAIGSRVDGGEDWPRFRGVNGTGVSTSHGLPAEFGPKKNLLWKIDASHGSSSPIISNGQLFFTSFTGDQRTLHCIDAATGKERWARSVKKLRQENASPPNGPATPTPATDGKSIFVLYPDVGVLCYSPKGEERWRAELQPFHTMHGIASSLITVDNVVIFLADQLAGSYIAAFNADTGKVAWKVDRADGLTGGYSTPSVYRPKNGPASLIVSGPLEVVSYDAATGKRLWWISGVTNSPISVPVIWHDRAFVCEELGEPIPFSMFAQFDKNKDGKISLDEVKSNIPMTRLIERIDAGWGNHKGAVGPAEWDKAFGGYVNKGGLVALDLNGSGDTSNTHVRWSYRKSIPTIPSALVYEDLVYVVKDGGILSAFEASTGKLVRQARLNPGGRQYDASPVAADGMIYLLDANGGMTVVKAGRDWKQLRTNELGEQCFATPAICEGRLYVRTTKSLFCFGA